MGGADAAGCARDPGASRAQPRGRRGGGEPEPEPEPKPELLAASVGGEYPGAARATAAATMAVAVGRPSAVSAGASLPSPAAPPALGDPALGRVPVGIRGTRAGAPDSGGCGCGCVHEFGRASATEPRARSPEARLIRDATVYRLVALGLRGCGRKRTPLLFSL